MPSHEFHSKFLSRNDKADKFRASVGGKLDGLIGDRVGEIVSGMQRNTRTTAEFCGVVYIVKPDGRVLAVDESDYPEEHVAEDWTGIVGVAAMPDFLLGLRRDGKVIIAADDRDRKRASGLIGRITAPKSKKELVRALAETAQWTDIIALEADIPMIAGLKRDGTVVLSGDVRKEDRKKISTWRDIVRIAGNSYNLYGLRRNGRIVSTDDFDEELTEDWTGIVDIAAGDLGVAGLRADGSVEFANCYVDVSGWSGIVRVAIGKYSVAGLDRQGNVLQVYRQNEKKGPDVSGWKKMREIAALSPYDFVGIREDGTVVSTIEDMEQANING